MLKIRKYAKPQNVSGQAMTTTNKINFDRMIIESKKVSVRQKEIVSQYLRQLDQHLTDLKEGKSEKTFEIKDLADLLFVSPKHLSNTIQEVLGKSPCDIYEERLIEISKDLLLTTNNTISHIAHTLTFDPSNFIEFFKIFERITPKQFRELHFKTELLTK
ncbi:MAG: helix-turn-helix transcriptional regulator [Cyclobacteriaceae bacterium]